MLSLLGAAWTSVAAHSQLLLRAVQSLKETNPDMLVALATDQLELSADLLQAFPRVITLEEPAKVNGMQKVRALLNSPFKRTLLVDAGVVFCKDISNIFRFVDNYDMAAVRIPDDLHYRSLRPAQAQNAYATMREEHSGAVSSSYLLVKRTPRTEKLMHDWLMSLAKTMMRTDEFWLGHLLGWSDVRHIVLPIELGLIIRNGTRLPVPFAGSVAAYYAGTPAADAALSCKVINQFSEPRLYWPQRNEVITAMAMVSYYDGYLRAEKERREAAQAALENDPDYAKMRELSRQRHATPRPTAAAAAGGDDTELDGAAAEPAEQGAQPAADNGQAAEEQRFAVADDGQGAQFGNLHDGGQ